MKKAISIILALVLVLSMSTQAFAAESGDIKVTYSQETAAVVTVVDITWGSMEFNYTSSETKVWNPETLQYEIIPGEGDGSWTPKNEGGDTVTVTNHSNTGLEVTVTYTPAEENGVAGSVTNGTFTLATAEGTDKNNAPKDSAKLALDNSSTPSQWGTDGATTIGSMTVTLKTVFFMDATSSTADELEIALLTALNAGTTDVSVTLAANADEETFTALRTAFAESTAPDGSINLTIIGAKKIPDEGFIDMLDYFENDDKNIAGDKLKSLTLTDVETIGEYAFSACTNLEAVNMPKVVTIGEYAFCEYNKGTKLTSLDLPNATTIGICAFANSSLLTSVNLPKVVTIGEGAFGGCDLRTIDFPEATAIGGGAFEANYNLVSCSAPKATTIGYYPWGDCSKLETLELTAAGDITISNNYFADTPTKQINLVLNKDKESQVTQNDDGTATWNIKDGYGQFYTFKSITFIGE